jgi:glucose-6-phosphate 1-dehydrogenase
LHHLAAFSEPGYTSALEDRQSDQVSRKDAVRGLAFRSKFPKEPNVRYETLIHDVMIGDQTLFMGADMVEQG